MKPNRSRSTALRGLPLMLLLVLGGVGLWLTFGLSAAPVPARKPAAYPAWWFQREVIPPKDAAKASPTYPGDYPPAADYAVLTQGQLKHLATAAFDELQAHLPGGAGPAVTELVKGWYVLDGDAFHLDAQGHRVALASPQTNDFAPVTHGQLKEVAHYFFDRLQAELYYPTDQPYPWDTAGAKPPADSAVANLGQAKNLFKFDLITDTIGDGIPDWWKRAHGLPITKPVAQAQTANGKMTSLAAFRNSLDPNDPSILSASSLAPDANPVVITRIGESLDNPTTLSGGTFIDIDPGSAPYIKNGDFEQTAENRSPVGTTGSNSQYRKWYVGEGPSPITPGGWTAIGGYHDKTDPTDQSRETPNNYLQWEVQQQIDDYTLPSRYGTGPNGRAGKLNQYAELDAHWERFPDKDHVQPADAIHDNTGANPSTSGWSDKGTGSDHGIQQTVNIPRGNYVLIFDYRGREIAARNNFKVTAKGDRDVDVVETLIADKNASEPASGDTSGVQKWKRALVSFNVDGGPPDPALPADPTLLPVVLKFDLKLDESEKADSFGVFIDNVILVRVEIDQIKGLYKSDGTYQGGYTAKDDDLGRIYCNSTYNPDMSPSIWTKNRQYVDLRVSITPADTVFPADARIVWESEDPDDRSNEDPDNEYAEDPAIAVEARKLFDPNDYNAAGTYDPKGDDNSDKSTPPTGSRDGQPEWEQINATYGLANGETCIAASKSEVRFNATDGGGDNFIIKAKLKLNAGATPCEADRTGIMTVWKRINVEYVKMASAIALTDLENKSVNTYFAKAYVELQPTAPTPVPDVEYPAGKKQMAPNQELASFENTKYCTNADGKFTHELDAGWFFVAAANEAVLYAEPAALLVRGAVEAVVDGITFKLPAGKSLDLLDFFVQTQNTQILPPNNGNRVLKINVSIGAGKLDNQFISWDWDGLKWQRLAAILSNTPVAGGTEITYVADADIPLGPVLIEAKPLGTVRVFKDANAEFKAFQYESHSWSEAERTFHIVPARYSTPKVENPQSLSYDLKDHGWNPNATPEIEIMHRSTWKLLGTTPSGKNGCLIFTKSFTPAEINNGKHIAAVIHELTHVLGFQHVCGNWDYLSSSTSNPKHSCAMHYEQLWMLDSMLDDPPPAPANRPHLRNWSEKSGRSYLCAPHISAIRKLHLEDKPNW